jgi:hypothetical protein
MKIFLKIVLVITILVSLGTIYRMFILPYLIKTKLSEIIDSEYFKNHQKTLYLFSDIQDDRSIINVNTIDNIELKENLQATINLVRQLVGSASRIWIFIDSNDIQNIKVKIETSKEWKDSLLYFGDYNVSFVNKDL